MLYPRNTKHVVMSVLVLGATVGGGRFCELVTDCDLGISGEGVVGTLGPEGGSLFLLNTGASLKCSGVSQCDSAASGDMCLSMEEFFVTSCPSGHYAVTKLPLVEETTRGADL